MTEYIEYVPGKKFPKQDAEISDSLDSFTDAGYVYKEDEIVIDIDHLPKEKIEDLIKRLGIKTQIVWTDRGCHLYYKGKPKNFKRAKAITPLGFEVEYKYLKGKNKSICIKRNGKKRRIDNEGKRETFPEYFKPMKNLKDMTTIRSGNRNQALYNHKARIFNIEPTREILEFINYNLFDEPLEQHEVETIARDETFTPEKGMESFTADQILRDHSPHLYNGQLFIKDGDDYISDPNLIDRLIYSYCPGMNTKYVEEVTKQIAMRCKYVQEDDFVIRFNNGYLLKGEFLPYDWYGFTPYKIDLDYNENAEPVQIVDDYLDLLTQGDAEYREYILEMIANTLIIDKGLIRSIAKFYIMVGGGGNGKGTFVQIIKKILGQNNCSSLSLVEMKDEKYVNNLVGKLANVGDDIENKPINEAIGKRLKNLSTADSIMVRSLYHNAEPAELIATLIFTSNHIIKSFDKSHGLGRRITWLPMFGRPDTVDKNFGDKITTDECLQYWLKLIIDAYKRLYNRGVMPECKVLDDYKKGYMIENNNTILFVQNLNDKLIDHRSPADIMQMYEDWCNDNGETPLGKKSLYETIRNKLGFEIKSTSVNGRSARVFMKVKE